MPKGIPSWLDYVSKSDGLGAIIAAVLTILGAWALTAVVQRSLDDREFDRNEVREKVELLYSVTAAAGESVGRVYARGQKVVQAAQWRQAGVPEGQKDAYKQQEIEVRKSFNEALEGWRASAVGWSSSLRFIDAAPDGLVVGASGSDWKEIEDVIEDYALCVRTPKPHPELAGALPCSQFEEKINGRVDDWISVLLTETAGLRDWLRSAH